MALPHETKFDFMRKVHIGREETYSRRFKRNAVQKFWR